MNQKRRAGTDVVPRRYADDDVIGAANEITDDRVTAAAALIRTGRRYSLAQVLQPDSPTQMWRYWRHSLLTDRATPERAFGTNTQTFVEESVSGALHSGTHLDGLAHVGIGPWAYGGRAYADIISADGLTDLGIEHVPPLVTRGVVLDAAATRRVEQLDPEYPITATDLETAAERVGVSIGPGDVLLVHTGWGALWDSAPDQYIASEPGIDLSAARWCADHRVSVIGADNWAVERVSTEPEAEAFAVHQETITRNGIFLLENVRTAELVADGVTTFFCSIAPIRLRGASGSMVNPVAVV